MALFDKSSFVAAARSSGRTIYTRWVCTTSSSNMGSVPRPAVVIHASLHPTRKSARSNKCTPMSRKTAVGGKGSIGLVFGLVVREVVKSGDRSLPYLENTTLANAMLCLFGGRDRHDVVVVMVVVSAWSTSGAHSRPANPKEERQRRGDDGMCCRLYQPSFPGIIMVATTHTFARCMALLHGFVRHSRRHRGPQLRQDLLFCVRSKRAGRNSSRGRSARPFSRALQVQHLYCSRLRHLRRRLRHWPDRGIGRLDEVGRIRGGGCGLFSFVRSFVRATAAGQLVRRLVTMIHSARRQPRLLVALTCVVHSPRRRRHVSFRHNVHGMSLFVGLDKWVRYHIHQC
jgi:hypothetical protein